MENSELKELTDAILETIKELYPEFLKEMKLEDTALTQIIYIDSLISAMKDDEDFSLEERVAVCNELEKARVECRNILNSFVNKAVSNMMSQKKQGL